MSTLRQPASTVTIERIDMMGLQGRENHPTEALNGLTGHIVAYTGYDHWEGMFERLENGQRWVTWSGESDLDTAPESVFSRAPESDETIHFYSVLIPGHGVFQIADYEIA